MRLLTFHSPSPPPPSPTPPPLPFQINESVPEDKVGIPRLSLEAPKAPEPLRPLSEAMGADEEVVWKRVYPLGEKSGLLVGVYKPDVEGDGPGEGRCGGWGVVG